MAKKLIFFKRINPGILSKDGNFEIDSLLEKQV